MSHRHLILAFGVLSSISAAGQDRPGSEAERQLFQNRCANCHQPPDLRFATDRAWLRQVEDQA